MAATSVLIVSVVLPSEFMFIVVQIAYIRKYFNHPQDQQLG